MLYNWLKPVSHSSLFGEKHHESFQWGRQIKQYSEKFPELKGVKAAIIGIGDGPADEVRKELYSMRANFEPGAVADLGNVRNAHIESVAPLLKELVDSKVVPIIIAQEENVPYAQYQAYREFGQLINMVIADESIPYIYGVPERRHYLNRILDKKDSYLFNLSVLGYQTHYTDLDVIKIFEDQFYEAVRLGALKSQLEEAEPVIRDADLMCFDLSVIKSADAPGNQRSGPSGFFSEEAARLARYAGMSDKLSSIGFYGYEPANDFQNQTAKTLSQLIWYFMDGFENRQADYPFRKGGLMEYVVNFKDTEKLIFWKSLRSGRWWMQVPEITDDRQERHRMIPCSYNDYLKATEEELPQRLLNAYQRFM